jgi:hypothetical protein
LVLVCASQLGWWLTGRWLMLIHYERKILLADWWLVAGADLM